MYHSKRNTFSFVITVVLIVSLTACTPAATPTPTPLPTASSAPTNTPVPPTATNTPEPTHTPTQTPTQTPSPTATATVTPVPQPGDLLLSETFDDNKNNWGMAFATSDFASGVSGGSLSINVKKSGLFFWSSPSRRLGDVDMTFEATIVKGGNSNTNFGAVCRDGGNSSYYWFVMTGDGQYTIVKSVNGKQTPLIRWTPTSAVHTGKTTNTIRVICSGDKLQLTVNGRTLATLKDDSLKKGAFGLAAGTFTQPDSTVTFDNLTVKLPQPAETFVLAGSGGGGGGGGNTPAPTTPPQPTTPPTGNGQLIIVMCQSINTAVTIFYGGQIVKQNALTSTGVNVYDLPAGHYDVQFNASGYYNLNLSYDILPGQAITQYIGGSTC